MQSQAGFLKVYNIFYIDTGGWWHCASYDSSFRFTSLIEEHFDSVVRWNGVTHHEKDVERVGGGEGA